MASGLAYVIGHSVASIALPLADANTLFIIDFALSGSLRKKLSQELCAWRLRVSTLFLAAASAPVSCRADRADTVAAAD